MNFYSKTAARATEQDIAAVAKELHCAPPAVHAVMLVEAAGGGFLSDNRPKILFEAHVFGRITEHEYDDEHPNVSAPTWDRSLYGATGAHQYDRLAEAMELNESAALRAASWGMFQVLGMNFKACGFADVQAFVRAMCRDERAHLDAFVAFCKSTSCARSIAWREWAAFARTYNGPGQVAYYAGKLKDAYVASAKRLQRDLGVTVDGIWGPKSQAAYEVKYG